ncbi:YcbK family protein [Aliihoeflea aestuarii]|uniref:YcbK family protein n=1 Tax=Aliihoeflea aestuarii TaxID=453840 RepID=UPI002092DC9C|nr:D-Ala-D-Ala carboxypeptidase family metallohydrolase [Aliihoeflea aestuarii]
MSANATRPIAFGRLMLAALTATLLASCSATSDTDGTLFGFSPQYGATGVPGEASVEVAEAVQDNASEESDAVSPPQSAAIEADADTADAPAAAPVEPEAVAETVPAEPAESDQTQLQAREPSPAVPETVETAAQQTEPEPAKRGFLSAFFSPQQSTGASAPLAAAAQQNETAPRPVVDLEDSQPALAAAATSRPSMIDTASFGNDALPGVRDNAGLFEISRRNGIDDDSDIDMLEGGGLYQVAYAPGLARLAPNGLLKQHDKVEVGCFRPELVAILRAIENRFGQKVIVTSGYRSPEHNRRVRGARASQHMACAAADIHVPGVHKMKVAEFVRAMPRRGGVGTYCHTESIHVDTGPERDWNWRCRRRG